MGRTHHNTKSNLFPLIYLLFFHFFSPFFSSVFFIVVVMTILISRAENSPNNLKRKNGRRQEYHNYSKRWEHPHPHQHPPPRHTRHPCPPPRNVNNREQRRRKRGTILIEMTLHHSLRKSKDDFKLELISGPTINRFEFLL